MISRSNVLLGLLGLILLAGQTIAAQQGSSEPRYPLSGSPAINETIRKDVDEVTLVFTVAARKRLVRSVLPQDVTVIDDGHTVERFTAFARETDLPLKIIILLDISGSMADKFRLERRIAEDFLSRLLRPQDMGTLIAFNDAVFVIESSPASTDNVASIRMKDPRRGTAIHDAVWAASEQLMASGKTRSRKAILLVTDGADNSSRRTPTQAVDAALRAEAVVFIVNTARGFVAEHMHKLADETGGQVWTALSPSDVAAAFHRIEESLRSQYVLAYKPPQFIPDGRFREIEITLPQRDLRVYCRKGYFAFRAAPP